MSTNKVSLENKGISNSKPKEKDRFAPADNEVSLSDAQKSSSVDGLSNTKNRFHQDFYDDRRYTEDDFADNLDVVSQQQLPPIPPKNEQMVQRWVSAVDDSADSGQRASYTRAVKIGWRPRPLESIPEEYKFQYSSTGKASSKDMGIFQVAELILMEMPKVLRDKRRRLAREAATKISDGVDNYVSEQTPFSKKYSQMSVDKREIEVTQGNRVPPVAD